MQSIIWQNNVLKLLDQTKLPLVKEYVNCTNYIDVADAIKKMKVRGAPAIGIAAAFGMALAGIEFVEYPKEIFMERLCKAGDLLKSSRPTAVNLFWAVDRMYAISQQNKAKSTADIVHLLENEAELIFQEDIKLNKNIGKFGLEIVPQNSTCLTHCNAGALATAGYGTALGVIRTSFEEGKLKGVYACETRPLLQGARLTTLELSEDNIPVTLITDSMAGYLMQQNKIDFVIVGADRISRNGDVANKIGTYSLAVLANYHKIPFYVAAPYSTIDLNISSGEDIIIEQRDSNEIRFLGGMRLVPDNIRVYNPAFDITPAKLITGIITDKGIIHPPLDNNIKNLF